MNPCGTDRGRPWEVIPQGVIRTTCDSNMWITRTTQQELFKNQAATIERITQSTAIGSTIAATIAQAASTNSTIKSQLQAAAVSQGQLYQRKAPICLPASALQTDAISQSAGISVKPITFTDCKGNQYMTSPPL